LYRESQLQNRTDNSSDLVRTVLESVHVSDIGIGLNTEREIILALKATAIEMCGMPQDHVYDQTDLLQSLKINCGNDDKLYDSLEQGIKDEMSEGSLKRSIVNMRKGINNHFKEQMVNDVLSKASTNFRFNRDKIKDVDQFIADIITQLEPLQMTTSGKDNAIIGEVDIGDDRSLTELYNNVKETSTGARIYKTGWQWLNDALQGGFRVQTTVVGALQHKYKTGFTLSVFAQIAMLNKPHTKDPNKKPLLLRISFEDELQDNLQFLYQYIKYDETREHVDFSKVSEAEMSAFVKEKLQVNGFHVKMLRVDPDQWTLKSLFNKIIEYEAQGYAVELLMLDYLSKLPTTGCMSNGPSGSDVMDQLSRFRNFCAAHGIASITPHQFSTEAKALIRGGMPEDVFVKEIAEKGYWERTKGLDRIYDCAILIHIFKYNKETYFTGFREKHRIPTILDEDMKYAIMKFPYKMPIPSDVNSDRISYNKLSAITAANTSSNSNQDMFMIG
jgi:hypothetical protein